ncbi:DUF58 domain-containing protein [Oscillatoria sp. CS-180]|uniref:DUF58 domain-containing protein n=1 Tax=Oscillatoria sp. CS-180 TaxID=3021720 RepID=UPI00232ACDF5|nr:DUF58 domain-containing protein [Oscillatoria sp. CS-180]MDB9528886.1 DUF58 domain-containing protein [Oscillatoria sp. CS-180]
MSPTLKLYGLLAAGGAIATAMNALSGPSETFLSFPLEAMLLFDGFVLLVALIDWAQVSDQQRAKVRREKLPRLSIGRDNPVTIHVSTMKAATLQIFDRYPNDFDEVPMPLTVRLPAKTSQAITYQVFPTHRGEYPWGDLQIRQRGPWGLVWRSWTVPAAQTVAVYPDLVGLRSLSIQLAIQSTGNVRQRKRIGIGTEFAELREYAIGDDPRFIDWKATARRSAPLIRVLEPEREQSLIVLLDRGRLMTANVRGLSRFDWGLNATLSLALAGLHRGDRVGVGVFDREMHTWMSPTGGKQHLQRLIEKLTPIQPALLESDYLGAVTQVATQQLRRALVVVITDIVDKTASAELLTALTRLKARHLPFCVTLRDPQVDQQAHQFTDDVADAYNRAVALDLLEQRQVAFAELKQGGVLVLDAPADQITEPLVEDYLRIKARNRL